MTATEIRQQQRRVKVLRFMQSRLSAEEIAEVLDVSAKTVHRDMLVIRQEMQARMADDLGVMTVASDVMMRSQARERELWRLFGLANGEVDPDTKQMLRAPDRPLQVQVLRELRVNTKDEVAVLQSLGLVFKAPERMAIDMRLMSMLGSMPAEELSRLAAITDEAEFEREVRRLLPGTAVEMLGEEAEVVPVGEVGGHAEADAEEETSGDDDDDTGAGSSDGAG